MSNPKAKGVPRSYALTLIGIVTLLLFLGVWAAILVQTVLGALADPNSPAPIQSGLVVAGGTVSTLIASLTAAAIGFSIAEAKANNEEKLRELIDEFASNAATPSTPAPDTDATTRQAVNTSQLKADDLAQTLSPMTIAAILAYLFVGLAVLTVWLSVEVSPEIVSGFALSLIGWLVGAAGIVFEKGDDE